MPKALHIKFMKPIVWGRELSTDRAIKTVSEMFGCSAEIAKRQIEDALNGVYSKSKQPLGIYPDNVAAELVSEFKRVFDGSLTILTVQDAPRMNELFKLKH